MSLWIVLRGRAAAAAIAFTLLGASGEARGETPVGAVTAGGLVGGARVVRVTTLADAGPGSLRAALAVTGPRVVVFEVGGRIALRSPLAVTQPHLTVAGQTAPSPGVTLTGASLIVRTSHVVIEHIAVRRGPGGAAGGNLDAISIGGGDPDRAQARHVRLSHVSASWGVDETIGIAPPAAQITVEHSIVAESLRRAGHPKGAHSNGLLIGRGVEGVAIRANLFISNAFRNPVVGPGASALVIGNVIANPQHNAAHFYAGAIDRPTRVAFVDNVLVPGPDTRPGRGVVTIPPKAKADAAAPIIFVRSNCVLGGGCEEVALVNRAGVAFTTESPVVGATSDRRTPEDRLAAMLATVGSRPTARDPVDTRLAAEAVAGGGQIIDAPPLTPDLPSTARAAALPVPAETALNAKQIVELKAWLCAEHAALGGARIASCVRD